MKHLSSKVTLVVCASLMVSVLAGTLYGQQDDPKYPRRPITFLVGMLPGGPSDVACRLVAQQAEKFLGQPIMIVNKPGGSATLATAALAAAKPDGYTIGHASSTSLYMTPFLEKLSYSPVKDLRFFVTFGVLNFGAFVNMDSPFKKWQDLVAFARENPKKATYGTSGTSTMHHIIMEEIAKKEGVQFAHMAFRSGPESQAAMLGGHLVFDAGDFPYSLIEAKKIRLLLLLSQDRVPEYPDVPILPDFGYDLSCPTDLNVSGPRGIPDGIANKIETAFTRATKEPAFIKGMKDLRLSIAYRDSKRFAAYMQNNYERFGKILKERGIAK